jgi:serine/threonine protein kinase
LLAPGDIVDGKYRVVRLLGVGGMGAVYEGHNLRIDRRIAIKVMHASIAEQLDAVARFEREAQAAARIGSSHIVDVFDLGGLPSGERFMVMEFLEGESLLTRFKTRGPMAAPEAAGIIIQLLEGLMKVHEAGIVHRDLKPANVFLVPSVDGGDFVKILDFGVCKILQDGKPGEIFTGVGDILGTPSYMSPEQLEHGPHLLDARSDLYAVGVLLYRALSGRLPYRAANLVELLLQLRAGRAEPIDDVVDVDPSFGLIITKATEWDAGARYQTAHEFQQALVDWLARPNRIDRLLTDFLQVSVARRAVPGVPPPRAPSPEIAEPPTDPRRKPVTVPRLPPPRSPERKAAPRPPPSARDVRSQAPTLPDDGGMRRYPLPAEAAPRRTRKGSAKRIDPPAPPAPAKPVDQDEEETTVKKPDPARKRPRRA